VGIWDVKNDEERERWVFTPFASVGPLRFGMGHDEVAAALDNARAGITRGDPRSGNCVEAQFIEIGVTAYYADSSRLAGVAIDALHGPQVTLAGTALVGRVPSQAEQWICDHAETHGMDLCYSHEGNPRSRDLGLIMRVQRAADVVLSRPLFLIREWSEAAWDHVPPSEWCTF
jgi:hypothetical protein